MRIGRAEARSPTGSWEGTASLGLGSAVSSRTRPPGSFMHFKYSRCYILEEKTINKKIKTLSLHKKY